MIEFVKPVIDHHQTNGNADERVDAVTIVIADDQPVFRLGLRTALDQTEGMSVVAECAVSDEALELASNFNPRIVFLGTSPPRHRSLDICRRIGQHCPGTHVILMTPSEDSAELFEGIRSGASGYLRKLAGVESVLQVIGNVCRGEVPLQETLAAYPEVGRRLLQEFQSMARNPRLRELMAPLSPREMELLRLLGQGRSNKEIAHTAEAG